MKNSFLKRGMALVISMIMVFTLAACTRSTESPAPTQKIDQSGQLFDSPTEISIMVMSVPSWPYDNDWAFWRYMREATGATLKVQAVPASDFSTKLALVATTPSELPDLAALDSKVSADIYSEQGSLIAIEDYLDQMPYYTKFWNSIPKEERNERLNQRKSGDGKTYYPQSYGMDGRQGLRSWMYREDVFAKHNLKVPTNFDELYDVCIALKKLYPQSYPWCLRQGLRNINLTGPEWKDGFTYKAYYDFDNKKWCYGLLEDTALEQVAYMLKMYKAGLIPPDYLSISAKAWEELMSTDRGFITTDFTLRIDSFTSVVRKADPNFKLTGFAPPIANAKTGVSKLTKYNVDPKGYILFNTKDKKRIANTIKFIDWFYSDKAADLMSWGKEGETYKVVNGTRQYIADENEDLEQKYGRFNYGTYLRVDPEAAMLGISDTQRKAVDLSLETMSKNYNPAEWIAFNGNVAKDVVNLQSTINTYVEEMLAKFLLGQKPLSEWDSFIKNTRELGTDSLLNYYKVAYEKATK